jgi:hypothetical protein
MIALVLIPIDLAPELGFEVCISECGNQLHFSELAKNQKAPLLHALPPSSAEARALGLNLR